MQKEEPLIHILYSQLRTLILIWLWNIIKESALESISFRTNNILALSEDPENCLNLPEFNIGERAKETVATLPKVLQIDFLNRVRKFYVGSVKNIVGKVKCFSNVKYFQCLIPETIKKSESVSYLQKYYHCKILIVTNYKANGGCYS